MKVKIKVFRHNPQTDDSARYDTFEIDISKGRTILKCLEEIRLKYDPSLAFQSSCGSAICGGCGIRVNGKSRLACKTQALDEVEKGNILLEPMPNFPLIKDLVVDKTEFWNKIKLVKPYLIHDEKEQKERKLITEESMKSFKNSQNCILCSICYAECSSVKYSPEFLGPAASVKCYRFLADPRDTDKTSRAQCLIKNQIWSCSHQFHCTDLCPKDIAPSNRIYELKNNLFKNNLVKNKGAKNSLFIVNSVKKFGKLDFRSWGVKVNKSFFSEFINNIKLGSKSRINPLFMKKIKNINQVKKIFKRIGENG